MTKIRIILSTDEEISFISYIKKKSHFLFIEHDLNDCLDLIIPDSDLGKNSDVPPSFIKIPDIKVDFDCIQTLNMDTKNGVFLKPSQIGINVLERHLSFMKEEFDINIDLKNASIFLGFSKNIKITEIELKKILPLELTFKELDCIII